MNSATVPGSAETPNVAQLTSRPQPDPFVEAALIACFRVKRHCGSDSTT